MPEARLSAGLVEYEDTGGTGTVMVLLHGLAMNATVWRNVVADLRADHRCVVPTLPLGGHRRPMDADADLSFRGHVRLIAEFLERLELRDVVLVQSDMGFAQLLVAEHPERVGRLVLISCEAFENCPPGLPGYLLKYLRSADKRVMLSASEAVGSFQGPALVVWAKADRVMPPEHGRRLADLLPQGRLVEIPDSYTLIMEDQPAELARVIREFVRETSAVTT